MNKLPVYRPVPLEQSDLSGIKAALEKNGVCVIANILSEDTQQEFLDLFWQSITRRNKSIRQDDPSTWTEDNTDWYGTFGAGQYKHYGMAQEQHCWLIRKNKTIRRIFEEGIFAQNGAKEDCCVSLDGCAALFRPCVSGLKLHVDAVPGVDGWDWGSIQGAYNLYAVETNAEETRCTAGFACVVGSHRVYEQWWGALKTEKNFKAPSKHWCTLPDDSPLQQQVQIIASPPNSLVLWRSDLAHKNYGGDFTTAELGSNGQHRLARLTQFITFQPKRYRTEEVRHRKAQSVLDGVCNNHWAALSLRVPIIPFPAWSAAAKKILCQLPFAAGKRAESVASAGEGVGAARTDERETEGTSEERQPKRPRSAATDASEKDERFASLPAEVLELL